MRIPRSSRLDSALIFGLALSSWLLVAGFLQAVPGPLTFVVQVAALGTLVGTAVALWQHRRDPHRELAPTIATFTVLAALLAVAAQLAALLIA